MIKSGSACLGRVLDRHASTMYISSRASWAVAAKSIRIARFGRLALRVLDAVLAGLGRCGFKTEYFIDGASVLIDRASVKEGL